MKLKRKALVSALKVACLEREGRVAKALKQPRKSKRMDGRTCGWIKFYLVLEVCHSPVLVLLHKIPSSIEMVSLTVSATTYLSQSEHNCLFIALPHIQVAGQLHTLISAFMSRMTTLREKQHTLQMLNTTHNQLQGTWQSSSQRVDWI